MVRLELGPLRVGVSGVGRMAGKDQAAEVAALKARVAELEGGNGAGSASKPPERRVSTLFLIGIVFMPYIFVWFLLRKGYSQTARILGFGWLVAIVAIIHNANQNGTTATKKSTTSQAVASAPVDPKAGQKEVVADLAKQDVPKFMKDPDSARFGRVWGTSAGIACGYVNGKNSFGAMTGEQRFIYTAGSAEFDSHSARFAKHWNTLCVEKLLSTPPAGLDGKRWGSAPTSDLKLTMPTTDEGLTLYVPKAPPAPLEGVPVAEADYGYDHRRLYTIDLYIDGDANREAIKAALVKRYGTPVEYDEAANSYKWAWPQRRITIAMSYQENFKRTTVTFSHGS